MPDSLLARMKPNANAIPDWHFPTKRVFMSLHSLDMCDGFVKKFAVLKIQRPLKHPFKKYIFKSIGLARLELYLFAERVSLMRCIDASYTSCLAAALCTWQCSQHEHGWTPISSYSYYPAIERAKSGMPTSPCGTSHVAASLACRPGGRLKNSEPVSREERMCGFRPSRENGSGPCHAHVTRKCQDSHAHHERRNKNERNGQQTFPVVLLRAASFNTWGQGQGCRKFR